MFLASKLSKTVFIGNIPAAVEITEKTIFMPLSSSKISAKFKIYVRLLDLSKN